jgi:NADP-dependent 3-hydroxy acid dehydrogenase YdfG
MGQSLEGQVAWVTGAGSGIGQAAAVALAGAGVAVVLTGRRAAALAGTARLVERAGGKAKIVTADVSQATDVDAAFQQIDAEFGRCDILVNSAGLNVPERSWRSLKAAALDAIVDIDLKGAFYTSIAVLPAMRAQKSGLLIQVSSWAGRYVSTLTGPAYSAAKHGMVAMSESINQEECGNGIRSCCICPGEVATPLLEKRPAPVSDEDKARMLQSEDLGAIILFVARMAPTVCVNEILISPTWNRLQGA